MLHSHLPQAQPPDPHYGLKERCSEVSEGQQLLYCFYDEDSDRTQYVASILRRRKFLKKCAGNSLDCNGQHSGDLNKMDRWKEGYTHYTVLLEEEMEGSKTQGRKEEEVGRQFWGKFVVRKGLPKQHTDLIGAALRLRAATCVRSVPFQELHLCRQPHIQPHICGRRQAAV